YTWLHRISVNTAKNYLILQGRRPPSNDINVVNMENFETFNILKEISNPENLILSEELRKVVFQIIQSLPECLRLAIILREFDGLSYEEISIIMDCPIGTVRSRIFRAREAIDNKVKPIIRN
ncbi:MAG: sigma-70 family RNA polymerase sigma factor, partial [Arsenophonus sp. ET-DL12-MAG3]